MKVRALLLASGVQGGKLPSHETPQSMVEDRRADLALEQIEQAASGDDAWWTE